MSFNTLHRAFWYGRPIFTFLFGSHSSSGEQLRANLRQFALADHVLPPRHVRSPGFSPS
jgi:hypothetical protein